MKSKKVNLAFLSITLLVVGGLVWAGAWYIKSNNKLSVAISAFKAPSTEKLVGLDELPPSNIVRPFVVGDDVYTLELTFDKRYISPLPRSSIKGTVRLLKNGKVINQIPSQLTGTNRVEKFGQPARTKIDPTKIQLNLTKLNQNIHPNVKFLINGEEPQGVCDYTALDESFRSVVNPYASYSQIGFGAQPQAVSTIQSYVVSAQALNEGRNLKYGQLDISSGQAEFEYVFDGKRILPYLEFELGTERGELLTSQSVFFEDQKQSRVTVPDINRQLKGSDIYYDMVFSESRLNLKDEQTFDIEITSRDTNSGEINTNPFQRVILTLIPPAQIFELEEIRQETRYDGSSELAQFFYGHVNLIRPGHFIHTDELADYYGAMVGRYIPHRSMFPNSRLYYTNDCEIDQSFAVELDLIDGYGRVEFSYSGSQEWLPYLTFLVQPTNYFFEYAGWQDGEPPHQGAFSGIYLGSLSLYEQEGILGDIKSMYRETEDIIYPPLVDESGNDVHACPNFTWATSRQGCYKLYGNDWMDEDEFQQFINSVYTIASLPIGSVSLSSSLSIWWWFILLQIFIGLGGGLILRQKIKLPNGKNK
ncbi:hypothetical protein DRH29_01280 [candidate division Kazan bacterium]|uniref:Uncharacterized protein n=1 Tax=candidate division Kazan bacterium TaxID=2202143 RepID=A0A420ZDL4_UNCK3|nr:MAG: hypothetical protein DRH29_01280 [candidate division Kazan bacterium]